MPKGVYERNNYNSKNNYKHGMIHHRLYRIWANIKTRCYNENFPRKDWQNKKIIMCDEWKNDFMNFYKWSIENGYNDHLTIDRIDNNGNYEPLNCRWVDYHVQAINKNNVPKYVYNNIIFTQGDVYKLFKIKRTTFQQRINKGMSVKEAIETPVKRVHHG